MSLSALLHPFIHSGPLPLAVWLLMAGSTVAILVGIIRQKPWFTDRGYRLPAVAYIPFPFVVGTLLGGGIFWELLYTLKIAGWADPTPPGKYMMEATYPIIEGAALSFFLYVAFFIRSFFG